MGGGDKCLLPLADGQSLLARIVARLAPQVGPMALNANGDPSRFAAFDLPVLPDQIADAGPLAGVLAAMVWARGQGCDAVVTVAGDTPFFPADLVARLAAGRGAAAVALAATDRVHPVFGLWDVALAVALEAALADGTRRVMDFAAAQHAVTVDFPVGDGGDPFFNVNTPDDLRHAQARDAGGARP